MQCVNKCYIELRRSVDQCIEKKCKQEACEPYAYNIDGAPTPSRLNVRKLKMSEPVGDKIELTWDPVPVTIGSDGQTSQVLYTVQSRRPDDYLWNFDSLVDENSIELNYETCKFYRVAAITTEGSKGYSSPETFIPESPTDLQTGPLYYDNFWVLTEVSWTLPSRTPEDQNDLDTSDNLGSWGPEAKYVLHVEISGCGSYTSQLSAVLGLSGVETTRNKYLLKVPAPELKGCAEYHVKVGVKLGCAVYGETAVKKITIDRSKPCAVNNIINSPDCPNDEKNPIKFPFADSSSYDMILESEAISMYSSSNYFAIKVRWLFSNYTPNAYSIPVTVSWQKLAGTRNYSVQSALIQGMFEHTIKVDPDSTYNVRVSQGRKINPNNPVHSVYVSPQLEIEYIQSISTQATFDNKQSIQTANVHLLSLTPSILTLLIVMATFMVVLLIGLLSFVVKRKLIGPRTSNRHRLMHPSHAMRGADPNMYYWWSEEQTALAAAQASGMFDSWEVQLDDVFLYDVIVQGSYGAIYKGAIPVQTNVPISPTHGGNSPQPIATDKTILPAVVKMLAESVTEPDKFHFRKEVEILKRIGYHDNLLNLLACTTLTEPMCMVLENGVQGDLLGYLRMFKMESTENEYSCQSSPNYSTLRSLPRSAGGMWNNRTVKSEDLVPPSSGLLESFAKQISLAMCHLSSKGLFHRDLACRNVMLTQDYHVKVGDYSMVRFAYSNPEYFSRISGKLPIKWMAIEVLRDQTFGPKSDVWSFGVLLYELCTMGSVPFANIPSNDLLKTLKLGYRMDQPKTCSDQLYSLMRQCWSENPDARPDFNSIASMLTEAVDNSPTCLIQLNCEDGSSSGEQHHAETNANPPPIPPKKPFPESAQMSPLARHSLTGSNAGNFDNNTLSSSEAGSMKRKQLAPSSKENSLRKASINSSLPQSACHNSANNSTMVPTHRKSSTNEMRENDKQSKISNVYEHIRTRNPTESSPSPYKGDNTLLKTFASKNGNQGSNTSFPTPESLPRKPSSRKNSQSTTFSIMSPETHIGDKEKPVHSNGGTMQSFGGRQTPISHLSNSGSNNPNSEKPNDPQTHESVVSKFI